MPKKSLLILGCRGIPAEYGGFETFAQRLSVYLTSKGWSVTVYCQNYKSKEVFEGYWQDIHLVHLPVSGYDAVSSIIFDWKSTIHAARQDSLILTLGYNTAIFCFWYRLKGLTNVINMDGLEWRRAKWKLPEKIWLYLNEWFGSWLGNHLIADHPEIEKHLTSRVSAQKITMIPYGTDPLEQVDVTLLEQYNLIPNEYVIVIARPEPENHIREIVSAFSSKKRTLKLVIIGLYLPVKLPYYKEIIEVASEEVIFPGRIYDKAIINTLRFYARLYVHGHSVGGTNPSLVEALAAGSAVLAHDNLFNRWVAGEGAYYFEDELDCIQKFDRLLADSQELERMKEASLKRYQEEFSEQKHLKAYEALLTKFL
jgi:glycosyltransferase involved in cell wall biosynthesis